jgi:uncharacterized protein (TIGR02266 family)
MRIKLKYPDVDTFIQKYAANVSKGGIFIATRSPKAVGTALRFEFVLAGGQGESVIRGEGVVQWTREFDPTQPTRPHGMGVKFTRIDAESMEIVERALAFRARQKEGRGDSQAIPTQPASPSSSANVSVETGENALAPADPNDAPTRSTQLPFATPEEPTLRGGALRPAREAPPARPPVKPEPAPVPVEDHTQRTELIAAADTLREPLDDEDDATTTHLRGERRQPEEVTRPVSLPEEAPRPPGREWHTRPIEIREPAAEPVAISPDDSVRIALERHRRPRGSKDDLDALAYEWGLSAERIERTLKKKRPRGLQATVELEKLLRRPPRIVPPSREEAVQLLAALLDRR